MASKIYRLKIASEGKEFEAEGDKAFVLAMVKQFGFDAKPEIPSAKGGKPPIKSAPASGPPGKGTSLREFILQLNLKKHTDFALAFGYYLEKFRGNADFSSADINSCYYEAKMESSNTSQMITNNIGTGRMMESKKKSEKGRHRYTLTHSGEQFIEKKLGTKA
jgi:hypothetical protein